MDLSPSDVGLALGTAASSFAATWVALVRPLAGKMRKHSASPEEVQALRSILEDLKAELGKACIKIDRLEHDAKEASRQIDKVEEKQGRTVTQEEFSTYASTMQQSLQGLIEKLGHATGTIEAWVRQQPAGR